LQRRERLRLGRRREWAGGERGPVAGEVGAAELVDGPDPEGGEGVDEVAAIGAAGARAVEGGGAVGVDDDAPRGRRGEGGGTLGGADELDAHGLSPPGQQASATASYRT